VDDAGDAAAAGDRDVGTARDGSPANPFTGETVNVSALRAIDRGPSGFVHSVQESGGRSAGALLA